MRRRLLLILAGALAVVAASAAVGWFLVLPEWRPSLRPGERYGIDVSAHQGRIDWRAVRGDGIRFAYLKATEGGDFTDARFAANWQDAAAAGIDRGAYHFFTLCTPGAVQARHFLSVAPPEPQAGAGAAVLPPAVDLELVGNCSARPAPADVAAAVDEFLGIVEQAWGRPVLLYVGREFEARYPTDARLAPRPRWPRRFVRRPGGDWAVWQLHGFARVHGVRGRVDLDVMAAGWSGGVTRR